MTFIKRIMIYFMLSLAPLYAEGPPLNVGIQGFNPPFEMQQSRDVTNGFDVDMMNALCKIMNRTCVFHFIKFNQLFNAVQSKQVDVAVSSITITVKRSDVVNFSLPYLLSNSRFLGIVSSDSSQPFSLALLSNKKIGVVTGTIFADQIGTLGISNPVIKNYETIDRLVEALSNKKVDYIFFDDAAAKYWAANSQGRFVLVGPQLPYGYGFGIAVNKESLGLLADINRALLLYQDSAEYKVNYNKYLEL